MTILSDEEKARRTVLVHLSENADRHFGFKVGNTQYAYKGAPLKVEPKHADLLCDPEYEKGKTANGLGLPWVKSETQSKPKVKTKAKATESE